MFDRFRRYEIQAGWSIGLALVSLGPTIVATWLARRNYDDQLGRIIYGTGGFFLATFAACIVVSTAVAFFGSTRDDVSAR